ncbi:MAG: ankyrin repeat protein [Alphaproteobacteria bacterium]|jgi:ankyrin repeat protein
MSLSFRAVLSAVILGCLAGAPLATPVLAQTAPDKTEIAAYTGLLAAAASGDIARIRALTRTGADANVRDAFGRTPLMVAGYRGDIVAAKALLVADADVNARDSQAYDLITIAAVANDVPMLKLAIASGGNTALVTSPYDGTALIAAAHLGHVEIVKTLIAAKAPLNHVNNLAWTALIEAIVLGDGGENHLACVKALVGAGADVNLPDGEGKTPLALARARGYQAIEEVLKAAGARP